jgi:hypothetical protein
VALDSALARIHVDMGLGKLTHIVAKARLSSASLWEHEIGTALTLLYGFLAEVLQVPFTLQVSEVHLCVDMADWGLALNDISAFITPQPQQRPATRL